MINKAFWRALHSLSHNVSVAAVVTLLVNDHLLRVWFPSWLSGKLGDFSWLVFAPFISALVFAWVVRGQRQERTVGALTFGFIGAWFVLAKTVPLINRWTIDALAGLLGYRGALLLDATDLLALPGLWIGWRVWRGADNRPHTLRPNVWAVMALGVMATVATSSGVPFNGIIRLCSEGADIFAFEHPSDVVRGYRSSDGGLTWTPLPATSEVISRCGWSKLKGFYEIERSPFQRERQFSDGMRRYRVPNGGPIESSLDNGKTWSVELDSSGLDTEARETLHQRLNKKGRMPGPLDAIVSEQGTVVMAMGSDGLVVRKVDGEWQWIGVGEYRLEEFSRTEHLTLLFGSTSYFTLAFVGLAALLIGKPFTASSPLRRAFVVGMCLVFVVPWVPLPVALLNFALPYLLMVELALAATAGIDIYRVDPKALVALVALSCAAGALFLLPFVLWAFETIPRFVVAQYYALILGGGAMVTCRMYLRRKFPHVFSVPGPPAEVA